MDGDGPKTHSRFQCGGERGIMGSLAARESLKAIGRAFGKPSSSIYFQVAPHGGIRPAPRRRSRLALTLAEREEISRGVASARSMRSMARLLGHSPSTVSREIKRNGGYDRYRAAVANEKARVRARRPKRCKLANDPRLRRTVVGKPDRIGRLRDSGLVEEGVSRKRALSRVTRDDLSQLVYSNPRCSSGRTSSSSSIEADDAATETGGRQARTNRGSGVN